MHLRLTPQTGWLACLLALSAAPALYAVEFSRDIRPLLSERCFQCHGPDQEQRATDLRLDQRETVFSDLGGYRAVVPGKPHASEVLKRVTSRDPELQMPPPDSGALPLSQEEVARLTEWIDEGAPWEEHWAFVAPRRPELAEAATGWARNAVDRFVGARLEAAGLSPQDEADRNTLLRRVTLDLTGLPPHPQEVEAFVPDKREGAYERVVDRLLGSAAFGEHMARYWLDAVRYGDTHGLHLDNYREMWPYRDWVISAFNKNLPFDRFVLEQLAGDLLPGAALEQQVASGFNRCHVTTSEGGSIKEEVYVRNVVDRVAATGTIFMGLTLGCAVCHDHKFDPVSQKEFYQLFAFFNSMDGNPLDGNRKAPAPVVRVPDDVQAAQLASLELRKAELDGRRTAERPSVDAAQRAWEASARERLATVAAWSVAKPERASAEGGAEFRALEDGSWLVTGPNPDQETYDFVWRLSEGAVTAVRLEALVDESLDGAAGRSQGGNAVLTDIELAVAPAGDAEAFSEVALEHAWADHSQGGFPVGHAIDDNAETGWGVEGDSKKENRTAVFATKAPFGTAGARLRVRLSFASKHARHQFGRLRLSVSTTPSSRRIGPTYPDEVVAALEEVERSAEQVAALQDHYRASVTDVEELRQVFVQLAELRSERKALEEKAPTTLVMKELSEPREAFVLLRGQYDQRGESVVRATPSVLPPMGADLPRNRLGFARWLLDPAHPLTARVTVNRFWQQCFGTGLVHTSEDFGNQGEPPSHPELLDWLAVDFVETGWDIKRLMRVLVTSATYRQSSRATDQGMTVDPGNRLLWRGPRFRLDAETLRDQALAASGLLTQKLGGASVKPPQPDGLWYAVGYTSSNTARFKADSGDKVFRRSVYTFWKRTAPAPQMKIFDAPSRESCTVRRERTNTPLQALLLLNDPQYVEAARYLAERLLREDTSDRARLEQGFYRVAARRPDDDELAELVDLHGDLLAEFRSHPERARELIATGETEPDPSLEPVALAAWTMVANTLLNLDEVITKE